MKMFEDPTAPMQKALQAACSLSRRVRCMVSQLSDGQCTPTVPSDVLQDMTNKGLPCKSGFSALDRREIGSVPSCRGARELFGASPQDFSRPFWLVSASEGLP